MKTRWINGSVSVQMPFFVWLGGAMSVAHRPDGGFWDALIWPYYIGRFIAQHFAGF